MATNTRGRATPHSRPAPTAPAEPAPVATVARTRPERERVAGNVVRAVRRSLGYSRDELRDPLRVGPASLARYELADAPPWMTYALIGIGVLERGVPVDEMVRRVVVEEQAAEASTPRGRAGTAVTPRRESGRKPRPGAEPGPVQRPGKSKRTGQGVAKRTTGNR